jgi:hypothetical protein
LGETSSSFEEGYEESQGSRWMVHLEDTGGCEGRCSLTVQHMTEDIITLQHTEAQ